MAITAKENFRITQLDIETTYLNGKVDVDIYIEKPELLKEMLSRMINEEKGPILQERARTLTQDLEKPNAVCKLKKALYGLRQAGRQWHTELDRVLRSIDLFPTDSDPCIYVDKE